MKKLLFGIFICFGVIFVMSHNANALNFNLDYNNYHLWSNLERVYFDLTYNGTVGCSNVQTCSPTNTNGGVIQVQSIQFRNRVNNIKRGDLIKVNIALLNRLNYTQQNVLGITNFDTNDSRLTVIGHNVIDQSEFSNTFGDSSSITTQFGIFKVYEVFIKVNEDLPTGYQFKLESSNTFIPLFQYYPSRLPNGDYGSLSITLYSYQIYEYVGSSQEEAAQKEMESAENIENQTPPSQSQTGDGAAATNLIGAFSGFVSALGGLSATNCNLTLNFPDFAGGSRVVNVCQNKDKAGNIISVFSSLTLIIFYVPLAIRLLTMIYNEIRSFTNG